MALIEPVDLLTGFPGWSTDFSLLARQEQSRHASGRTRVKDFGLPIWRGAWASKNLKPNELDRWRAKLSYLEVSQKTFIGYHLARCRPAKHPGSGYLPTGTLHTIGEDDMSVRVNGLIGISLTAGDMLQIGGRLYRALEDVSGPLTPLFSIEPHLWPGTATGASVVILKPACLMTIDPGSVSASADLRTGRGSVSFTATQAVGAGEAPTPTPVWMLNFSAPEYSQYLAII